MMSNKSKPTAPCWWCGEAASIHTDAQYDYDFDGYPWRHRYDGYRVQCRKMACRCATNTFRTKHEDYGETYGSDDALEQAVAAWDAGQVSIPLIVTLPTQHFVSERVPLPSRWSHIVPTRMVVVIPKVRGIADHFRRILGVIVTDGAPRPHEFRLDEPMAYHNGVILLEERRKGDAMEFVFQTRSTNIHRWDARSRADTAWLNREFTRPPVFDRMFEMLGKEVD